MSGRASGVSRTGGGFAVPTFSRVRSSPSPFKDAAKPMTPRFLEELLQRQAVMMRAELQTPPRFATLPKVASTYDPGSLFDREAPPRPILSSQALGPVYPSLLDMDAGLAAIGPSSISCEQQPRSPAGAHHRKRTVRPVEGGLQLLGREYFPSSPRSPQAHSASGASGSSSSSPSAGARTPRPLRPPLTPRTQLAVSPLTPRPQTSIALKLGTSGSPASVCIPSVRQARELASLVRPPQEPRAHPANRDQSAGGDTPPNECVTKRVASETVQSTLHFSTGTVQDERLSRLYSTKAAYRVAAAAPVEVVATVR